jgi:DNA-binding GntR family transcriptional regulator
MEMYTTLVSRIILGHYPPDTWLKEDQLSEEFKVSRTPVREVLRELEKVSLVQIIRNRGARVLPFNADDVEDLYEIRKSLELLALKFAAPSLSIHRLMQIRAMVVECAKSDDYKVHTETDHKLHSYFVEASGRRRLISLLDQLLSLLRFFREMGFLSADERATVTEEHLKFIDALCVRDVKSAETILERHIENAKMRVLSNIVRGARVGPQMIPPSTS